MLCKKTQCFSTACVPQAMSSLALLFIQPVYQPGISTTTHCSPSSSLSRLLSLYLSLRLFLSIFSLSFLLWLSIHFLSLSLSCRLFLSTVSKAFSSEQYYFIPGCTLSYSKLPPLFSTHQHPYSGFYIKKTKALSIIHQFYILTARSGLCPCNSSGRAPVPLVFSINICTV